MVNKSFASALKSARKRLDMTQETLGIESGCSRSSIAQYERGVVPTKGALNRILDVVPDDVAREIRALEECRKVLADENIEPRSGLLADGENEDVIELLMSKRRSMEADISGVWNAMWRASTKGEENRNREVVDIRKRWNGSWQFANRAVSDDNPDGGYLWIGRMELFDNQHLLGHYCARNSSTLAKGVMCEVPLVS
ncbi:MAG: helix-turn-helix transcriptional regulator [Pseudomonadota bacterium]